MSPISPELILFVIGAALFGVAVFVGRPPPAATGLARFGRAPRLACAGAGVLCVIAGVIVAGSEEYGAQADPVPVTIIAELAPSEVSEEVRVFLDGRDVGVIRVDAQKPKATLRTTVAATGRHEYHLESTRRKKGRSPERATQTSHVVIGARTQLGVFYNPENGKVYLLAF